MISLRKIPKAKLGPGSKAGSRFIPLGLVAGPVGGILSALLSNWKLAIFVLLGAFIFYQNYVSFELLKPFGWRTLPGIEQELAVVKEQIQACEEGRTLLKQEIEVTNQQIEKWVALSEKLQDNQAQLSTALVDLKKKSTTELEIILQGPIPQTCEGAVKLLRDAVTNGELIWKTDG